MSGWVFKGKWPRNDGNRLKKKKHRGSELFLTEFTIPYTNKLSQTVSIFKRKNYGTLLDILT